MWIEDHWDHKFLAWENDPVILGLLTLVRTDQKQRTEHLTYGDSKKFNSSIILVPFNPTAENMAQYLVDVIGPQQLAGTGVVLTEVRIEETAKCHASYGV